MGEIEKQQLQAYKNLYDSLTDFGQRNEPNNVKLDYVKARVFDTWVLLKRIDFAIDTQGAPALSNGKGELSSV